MVLGYVAYLGFLTGGIMIEIQDSLCMVQYVACIPVCLIHIASSFFFNGSYSLAISQNKNNNKIHKQRKYHMLLSVDRMGRSILMTSSDPHGAHSSKIQYAKITCPSMTRYHSPKFHNSSIDFNTFGLISVRCRCRWSRNQRKSQKSML